MSLSNIKNYRLPIFLALFLIYVISFKIVAAGNLSFVGDEFADILITYSDITKVKTFFTETIAQPDQSRFPHILSLPYIFVFNKPLLPLRIMFIIIHAAYLFVFFKTMRIKFSLRQSFYCTILVGVNTYLASFSTFTSTTSNSLFLFFAMLSIFYYRKHFEENNYYGQKSLIILSLLFGLTIGSRLTGTLLMFSILLYDLFLTTQSKLPKKYDKINLFRNAYVNINIAFIAIMSTVNLMPLDGSLKLALTAFSVIAFAASITFTLLKYPETERYLSFTKKWFLLILFSFNFAIIVSPTFLNFKNILAIFPSALEWDNSKIVTSSIPFDILNLFLFKLGIFAISLIIISFLLLKYSNSLISFLKDNLIFIMIFVIYIIFFYFRGFFLAWYPLFIFAFLMIPISYIIEKTGYLRNRFIRLILLSLCLIYPFSETAKYYYFFPYGHIDGAQHGTRYIGFNKPGFISSGSFSHISEFLKNSTNLQNGFISCNVTKNKIFNNYTIQQFNYLMVKDNIDSFSFVPPEYNKKKNNYYYLTSIYTPKRDLRLISWKYEIIKNFYIKDILVGSFWRLKHISGK